MIVNSSLPGLRRAPARSFLCFPFLPCLSTTRLNSVTKEKEEGGLDLKNGQRVVYRRRAYVRLRGNGIIFLAYENGMTIEVGRI